jgi:hypothetical protein
MAKSKKAQNNRKGQVATKTLLADTALTRRDVMVAGVTLATTVVGGQIVKYLPSPTPSPAPARTVSLGILWSKPWTPVQGDVDSRVAQGSGTVTVG